MKEVGGLLAPCLHPMKTLFCSWRLCPTTHPSPQVLFPIPLHWGCFQDMDSQEGAQDTGNRVAEAVFVRPGRPLSGRTGDGGIAVDGDEEAGNA